MWIKDGAVSEKHAEIYWEGQDWLLQDQGSSNGTMLNGTALEAEGVSCYVCCDICSCNSRDCYNDTAQISVLEIHTAQLPLWRYILRERLT